MRISGEILAAFVLLIFLFPALSTAEIISVKIRSHNRDMRLFSNFKFSHAGNVSVALSSVEISSIEVKSNLSQPDPSRIGFFLLSDEFLGRFRHEFEQNRYLCALDIKFISVLFTFRDLSPPPQSSLNQSYHVTYPGDYSLYFANCNDLSLVTMDVRTELYNIDDDGTSKNYLSAGLLQPSDCFKFLLLYLLLLGFWIFVSFQNRLSLQMIHLVMGVLLLINIFYFISAMADQHDLQATGTYHGWHILFYASKFMRDMHFFTVIVLIGAGWCSWRRFLPEWVVFNMTTVILLQVWANLTFIELGKSGPYNEDWQDLTTTLWTIDLFCCLVVFFHTFCSAVSFKEATDTSSFMRSYSSLKEVTCRQDVFPLMVLGYFFFVRVLDDRLPATYFQEATIFAFTLVMFQMYRPFPLDDGDEKCAVFLDHTGV